MGNIYMCLESKTLQSFLDLIPVKDVLSTVAKAGLAGVALTAGIPSLKVDHFKFDLAIDPKVFKHSHSRNILHTKECKAAQNYVTGSFSLTIEEVSGTSDQTKPKVDQNQVKIQGTIDLPKAAASTPAAQPAPSAKPN